MSSEKLVALKNSAVGKSEAVFKTLGKPTWINRGFKTINTSGIPGYRNFYGHGSTKFFIYPDSGWNEKKWGRKPFLGIVWADEEFYAVREAYSKGLIPVNQTFGIVALMKQLQ